MEDAYRLPQINKRPLLFAVAVGLFSFGLGFYLDSFSMKTLLLAAFAAVAGLFFLIPYNWAIRILFIYLGLEGMLKLLSGYNPIVHVGSDLLVVGLTLRWSVAHFIHREDLPAELPPLKKLFLAHVIWFFIEFANPYGLGIVASLAGAKIYLTMTTLYVFGFYLSKTEKQIHGFMGAWIVVALIQVVTGLYQGALGPISVLSISPAYAEPLRKFAGYAFRPFGTSHSAGGASEYIYLALPFFVYYLVRFKSVLLRVGLAVALPGAVWVVLLCQVRSCLVKGAVGILGFLLLSIAKGSAETRKKILITIPVVAALLIFGLPKITENWSSESANSDAAIARAKTLLDFDTTRHARQGASERVMEYFTELPLGAGLSRTGAAVGKFGPEINANPFYKYLFTDNFWAATLAETGIPGTLIITSLVFSLLFLGFKNWKQMQDPHLRALNAVLVSSLFMIVLGFWGSEAILYNPEAAFFWFFAGVMMKLPLLDRAEDQTLPTI